LLHSGHLTYDQSWCGQRHQPSQAKTKKQKQASLAIFLIKYWYITTTRTSSNCHQL